MMNRGFTLIELIVVIAIIGIVAGIVLFMVSTVRQRGVDAGHKEMLHQLHNALELYHADNGDYPADLNNLTPKYFNGTVPTQINIYSTDCLTYGGAVGGAMASCFVLDVPLADQSPDLIGKCWRDDPLGNGVHVCYQ